MLWATRCPALLKEPPTTTSPVDRTAAAAAVTPDAPLTPVPSWCHCEPSHRATRLAGRPPMVVKSPPARSDPSGRSVSIRIDELAGPLPEPLPKGDQVDPSQLAMFPVRAAPALVKPPPAIRSPLGMTTRAW